MYRLNALADHTAARGARPVRIFLTLVLVLTALGSGWSLQAGAEKKPFTFTKVALAGQVPVDLTDQKYENSGLVYEGPGLNAHLDQIGQALVPQDAALERVGYFTVLAPLWQRPWFLALAVLLVGLVIYAVYRNRVARLIELEQVRTRIATDLHDDIGASLTQIAILSEVVYRDMKPENTRSAEYLSWIASASRELVDSMSDIVWAINPERDHLSDLIQRVRRFTSDSFTARHIAFQFQAPDADSHIKLDADLRRQVFLICKETVTNILRHSAGTEVYIKLSFAENGLTLQISDNGKGFDPAQVNDGLGLISMRERAKKLNGELKVISYPGKGTTIWLQVPLGRRQLLRWRKSLHK